MSECSLSGRGQGHESNFYIVDFKNFATASRRSTGDIHNSSVVGFFMTPVTYAGFYADTCQSKGGSGPSRELPTAARGSEEGGAK